MAALTPEQIDALRTLDRTFGTRPQLVSAGRSVADKMRQTLPDLDDLTIGRALLEIAESVAHVVCELENDPTDTSQAYAALSALAGSFACAAVQLTELHWKKEMP